MQKVSLALIVLLFSTLSFSQNNVANLTISTTGSSNLKITFANKKYSLQDRSATFQSLSPGSYPLTIFQLRKKFGGGTEYVAVYDQTVNLTGQKHLEICVTRFGKVSVDEGNIERDDWNESYNNPQPSSNGGWNDHNNNYQKAVTNTQFYAIKNAISGEFSDADKLRMAGVVFKNNWLLASQLKEIGGLFFSDQNKLEFAKIAYDYCFDKGNFFTLSALFFSSDTKRQFLDFVNSK